MGLGGVVVGLGGGVEAAGDGGVELEGEGEGDVPGWQVYSPVLESRAQVCSPSHS